MELFNSNEQHMMQLYGSRYLNNTYCFYSRAMVVCWANPLLSQLAQALSKIALEGARVML